MKTEYDFFKEVILEMYKGFKQINIQEEPMTLSDILINIKYAEEKYKEYLAERTSLLTKSTVPVQQILDFDKKWGEDIYNTGF